MDVQSQSLAFQGTARSPYAHRNSVADFRPQGNQSQAIAAQHQNGGDGMVAMHTNGNGFGGSMQRRSGMGPGPGVPAGSGMGPGGAIYTREPATSTKNTSHVPCKFFMAGNCQAGKACPFSHSLDTFNHPAPCKYFAKGNCKYGYKCANPHLLPDGSDARRVAPGRPPIQREQFSLGPPAQAGYTEPVPQHAWSPNQPSSPLLAPSPQEPFSARNFDNLTISDAMFNSGQLLYGSSPDPNRYLPISPAVRALDATIPPTFDSSGPLAFNGPFPNSLPSRFGLGYSSPTTQTANSTAFGNLDLITKLEVNGTSNHTLNLGSSPPMEHDNSKYSGKRFLHSDRLRQNQVVASSLPMPRPNMRPNQARRSEDSSDDEINLLPDALSDIMTPEEKRRRFSRNEDDSGYGVRQSISRFGSPPDSKLGSPSNASPSGFGPLFARKQREENQMDAGNLLGSSPYGNIGEHLRNTSLSATISPSLRPIARPDNSRISGDISPFGMSSPPDRRPGGALSMLSQQFNSLRMGGDSSSGRETGNLSQPYASNGLRSVSGGGMNLSPKAGRLTRDVSSSSTGRTERIDEEPSIFAMDEQEEKLSRNSDPFRSTPWNEGPPDLSGESGRSSPGLGLGYLGRARAQNGVPK